jgi:hypothetical protein
MLLAAMPYFAGPEGPRIIREVWPLALVPGETDLPYAPAATKKPGVTRTDAGIVD